MINVNDVVRIKNNNDFDNVHKVKFVVDDTCVIQNVATKDFKKILIDDIEIVNQKDSVTISKESLIQVLNKITDCEFVEKYTKKRGGKFDETAILLLTLSGLVIEDMLIDELFPFTSEKPKENDNQDSKTDNDFRNKYDDLKKANKSKVELDMEDYKNWCKEKGYNPTHYLNLEQYRHDMDKK